MDNLFAGLGTSVVSSGLNFFTGGYSSRKAAKQSYKYAKELRDYENWYNSPAQTMKRFTEAGLNPNLIYSQGNNSVHATAPTVQPQDLGIDFSDAFNRRQRQQEIDLKREYQEEQLNNLKVQRMKDEAMINAINAKVKLDIEKFQTISHQARQQLAIDRANSIFTNVLRNEEYHDKKHGLRGGILNTIRRGFYNLLNLGERAGRQSFGLPTFDNEFADILKFYDF